MRRDFLIVFALLAAIDAGCPPTPAPDPVPTPTPTPDPKPLPEHASCATACERAAELGCKWAAHTAAGASCEDVCLNAQKWQPWDLACRTAAVTCAAADRCEP